MILCFYKFFMFFSVIAFVSSFSCFSVSLLSFRSVCINVLLNSGIGAEFFMTCTFGIGMLYSDIILFTYVQIVVYFLNAAFQFYTSKVI